MLRSDETLQKDVMAELACDSLCSAANVTVAVKNGVVRLTGSVSSNAVKMAAHRAAARVFGVDGIDQRLELDAAPAVAVRVAAAPLSVEFPT